MCAFGLLKPEDEGSMLRRNFRKYVPVDTMYHP
jgi:hypothetical protein